MVNNNLMSCLLFKLIYSYILLLILNIDNYFIYTYLTFPLDYLSDKNYKFIKDNNINKSPEEIVQEIYYKHLITKLEIGTPSQNPSLLIETNSENFYLTSINGLTKKSQFYQFTDNEYYNELLSKTYVNITCEKSNYRYTLKCQSDDTIIFNLNKTNYNKEFQFRLVKDLDDEIPGHIGLLFNDSLYQYTKGFITELKAAKLIDNYYWFFNFDKFSPLEKMMKGQFVIGGLPHEIYPQKYSIDDFETTSSAEVSLATRAWRLNLNKIYIDNEQDKTIEVKNKVMTFKYEIYNIIANMEFKFIIRDLFIDELMLENKCFIGNFPQNIYNSYNLTFYYCHKSVKDIIYERLPNLKFTSVELDYIFELTKEELFYEKDDYIYLMILFCNFESNTLWLMGQIFTSKYNFVFNVDKKQIGFYKKVNNITTIDIDIDINNENKSFLSNTFVIIIIIIGVALIFTFVGIFIGKKIYGWRRKILANELTDELDYDYKTKDDNNFKPDNTTDNYNYNNNSKNKEDPFGIDNNQNIN